MMRALLMCTITNFPGLGLNSGVVTKGYLACTYCGPHTTTQQSVELRKAVYDAQHRWWLPRNHHFREAIDTFDYCAEHGEAQGK